MNTNHKMLIVAVIALIAGAGAGYAFADQSQPSDRSTRQAPAGEHASRMHASMSDMTNELEGKTGDAFDRAFLKEMIVHHEGAVAMAEAALGNAQRAEIKTMAQAIITAQNAEIAQMRGWLRDWYGAD